MINRSEIEIAKIDDIPVLVLHHRLMFEEIWVNRNLELDKEKLEEMDLAYEKKLQKGIEGGICKAWIVKDNDQITGSCAVSIVSLVPLPNDPSYKVAYLHSVYTEVGYRGQGVAEKIIRIAIEYCRSTGINRVLLNASEAGRSIYKKLGFNDSTNSMNLNIKDI